MNLFLTLLAFVSLNTNHAMAMTKADNSYKKVMNLVNDYSESIKTEKGIILRGYGLHYAGPDKVYDGKIHEIDLSYSIDEGMKYEEAREFFYSIANKLLDRLNKNESILEYFHHSPVGYEDLHLSISFDYESKGYLKREDVESIHILGNEIYYFIVEKDGNLNEVKQKLLIPDVHMIEDIVSNTRCIKKSLPEKTESLNP